LYYNISFIENKDDSNLLSYSLIETILMKIQSCRNRVA
jgi:hypothetical protein